MEVPEATQSKAGSSQDPDTIMIDLPSTSPLRLMKEASLMKARGEITGEEKKTLKEAIKTTNESSAESPKEASSVVKHFTKIVRELDASKSPISSSLSHLRQLLQSMQDTKALSEVEGHTKPETNSKSKGQNENEDWPLTLPPLPTLLRQMSDMREAGLIDMNADDGDIEALEMGRTMALIQALQTGPPKAVRKAMKNNERQDKLARRLMAWGEELFSIMSYNPSQFQISASFPLYLKARIKKPVHLEISMKLPLEWGKDTKSILDEYNIQGYLKGSMTGKKGTMLRLLNEHLRTSASDYLAHRPTEEIPQGLVSHLIESGEAWANANVERLKRLRRRSRSRSPSETSSSQRSGRRGRKMNSNSAPNESKLPANEISDWRLFGSAKFNVTKQKKANSTKEIKGPSKKALLWHPEKIESQLQRRVWDLAECMGLSSGSAFRLIENTLASIENQRQRGLAMQILEEEKVRKQRQLIERKKLRESKAGSSRQKEGKKKHEAHAVPELSAERLATMSEQEQIEYIARHSSGEIAAQQAEERARARKLKKQIKRIERNANEFRSRLEQHLNESEQLARGEDTENMSVDTKEIPTLNAKWCAKQRSFFYSRVSELKPTCQVCFEEFDVATGGVCLSCKHEFCFDCWKGYLASSIRDGKSLIPCPGFKCNLYVEEPMIHTLCPEMYPKFRNWITSMYIKVKGFRWCPNGRCGMVAVAGDLTNTVYCQTCDNFSFCFGCGKQPHWPMPCGFVELYAEVLKPQRDYAASSKIRKTLAAERAQQISYDTKRCPKCRTAWFKDGGCNHFSCACGHHFCWVCLMNWSTHGSSYYKCVAPKDVQRTARSLKFTFREDATFTFAIDKYVASEVNHCIQAQEFKGTKWISKALANCEGADRSYIEKVGKFARGSHEFIRCTLIFLILTFTGFNVVHQILKSQLNNTPKISKQHAAEVVSKKETAEKLFNGLMKCVEKVQYCLDILDQILGIMPFELFSKRDRYQVNDLVMAVQQHNVKVAGQVELMLQLLAKEGEFMITKEIFDIGLSKQAARFAATSAGKGERGR